MPGDKGHGSLHLIRLGLTMDSNLKSTKLGLASLSAQYLEQFFRDFRQSIVELEEAYRRNSLRDAIDSANIESRFGIRLHQAYEKLLSRPVIEDRENRRIETVYALLGQFRDQVLRLDHWFPAAEAIDGLQDKVNATGKLACQNSSGDRKNNRDFMVASKQVEGKWVPMRLDQLIAARKWGIGFYFANDQLTDRLTSLIVQQSIDRFTSDINDLGIMLPRLLDSNRFFPNVVPPASGRGLEQLVADILNEDCLRAQLASLCEDYSQKTDLRVRYSHLCRKRGARVQVTWAATLAGHQSKVDNMKRSEQYVIFSPWALASAIPQFGQAEDGAPSGLSGKLIDRFWSSLGSRPSDFQELAVLLKGLFSEAVSSAFLDPRGPMASVPKAIRELIRAWVEHESIRSTLAVRAWEKNGGRFRARADGRLVARVRASIPS